MFVWMSVLLLKKEQKWLHCRTESAVLVESPDEEKLVDNNNAHSETVPVHGPRKSVSIVLPEEELGW